MMKQTDKSDKPDKKPEFTYELTVTSSCNNNCLRCDNKLKSLDKEKNLYAIERELEEAIGNLDDRNRKTMLLIEKEPTMRIDLIDIIRTARDLGFQKITLQTNARLFSNKKYCEILGACGIDLFEVHLYGKDKSEHDTVTRTPNSYEQALKGIKNLIDYRQRVKVLLKNKEISKGETSNILSNFFAKPRVLLINPSYQPHWSCCEPTGVMQLASCLEEAGFNARILDYNISPLDEKKLLLLLGDFSPEFVGITALTRQANRAYRLGRLIKENFKRINLVYGGVHPTCMPEEAFHKGAADFVVLGQAEKTFVELLSCIIDNSNNKNDKQRDNNASRCISEIKNIVHRKGRQIINNRFELISPELDSLPLPAYYAVPIYRYNSEVHVPPYNRETAVHIMSSRGCMHDCTYCASPFLYKKRINYRSIDNVIKEIRYLLENYNIWNIHFHDDNFLLDHKRVKELCKEIIEEKLDIKWICLANVTTLVSHPEIIPIMKQAGCVGVEMGVESGDERVFERLCKIQNIDEIKHANSSLKKNKIVPMYLIMGYCPGEDIESPYLLARLLYELKNEKVVEVPEFRTDDYDIMGHLTRPSPGSSFYGNADQQGIILATGWDDHFEENLNFVPNELLVDTPIIEQRLGKEEFMDYILRYKETILTYIYTVFYSSTTIMEPYFKNINSLADVFYKTYSLIDNKSNVRQIMVSNNEKQDVTISTISLLSALRLIKSKNYNEKHQS